MSAPTVFFIDDSATMREVIKIAFRRENIEVVACHDGDAAMTQMQQQRPDVVISDVIMPGKDGYEVCQQIKQMPGLGDTPVVLMSGVVNRQVAEKAFAVKADELIRKPFQPQDLIARVKQLLQNKKGNGAATAVATPSSIPAPVAVPAPAPTPTRINGNGQTNPAATLSNIFSSPVPPRAPSAEPAPAQSVALQTAPVATAVAPAAVAAPAARVPVPPVRSAVSASGDAGKLRIEVLRLENLVKKLQSELEAEREYARALEEHIKTLQENE
ncbi:MAG TPA: response regulator [Terriglobales bacterium]|nr:response regulator [Terriglobales bacterium]